VPKMLTVKQFTFTGPCYGPGAKQTRNYSTVKGLKRAVIRLPPVPGRPEADDDPARPPGGHAREGDRRLRGRAQDGDEEVPALRPPDADRRLREGHLALPAGREAGVGGEQGGVLDGRPGALLRPRRRAQALLPAPGRCALHHL